MKTTLTTTQAADCLASFRDGSHFTYAGARALVEYLEELEDECGEEIELDPIALCCDYSEYPSLQEWADDNYGLSWIEEMGCTEENTEDEIDDAIREYIQHRGTLIEFDGGVIVSSF